MKSNSDTSPLLIEKSAGKTQVRFNIEAVEKEDMDGKTRSSYDYDFATVEGELTRGKIISAIISESYSKDAEIAAINNLLADPNDQKYIDAYAVYQSVRAAAKSVATEAGFPSS